MYFGNNILAPKNIRQQAQAIIARWPGFKVQWNEHQLSATGNLKPTARSDNYTVNILYRYKEAPDVILLNPKIVPNFNNEMPEHLFSQERLCLYRAIYGEFKYGDLISETILPWTSLWLYHYEVWHLIGEWMGGGEHPS